MPPPRKMFCNQPMVLSLNGDYFVAGKQGRVLSHESLDSPIWPFTNNGQALWISISIWVSSNNIVMKYAKAMGVRAEAIGLYAHSMQATAATDVVVAFHAMRGMYLHAERLLAKAG